MNKVIEKLRDEHLPGKTTIVSVNGERMEVRLKPVGILALHIWKKAVLSYAKERLDNMLIGEILEGIGRLRRGEKAIVDLRDLDLAIKSICECDPKEYFGPIAVPHAEQPSNTESSIISMYESDLEAPLIEATREFYAKESAGLIAESSITEYVRYAENRLREEIQLAKTVLPIGSVQKLISAVEVQLIYTHTKRLQRDFSLLLAQNSTRDLEVVYRLLKRIPDGIEPLAVCFETFVHQQGVTALEAIQQQLKFDEHEKCCAMYVSSLAPLLQSLRKQIAECCDDDSRFHDRITSAFNQLVDLQPPGTRHDSGHLLADFFDLIMQNEIVPDRLVYGDNPTKAIRTFVDDAVMLVAFLEDKESFSTTYVLHLAKRLLFRLSHHGDIETSLITQLGQVCGHEMQVRMQKMFTNMHTSLQLRSHFAKYLADNNVALNIEVNVQVPTYVVWPLSPLQPTDPACRILPEMEKAVRQFEGFYRANWQNKQLHWLHHLSRVHIDHWVVNTGRHQQKYELITTIPQAALLMQLQNRNSIRASELSANLQVNWKDFQAILRPIISVGLLIWREGEEGCLNGEILYNAEFTCTKSRIRLCHYTLGSSIEADSETPTEDGESVVTGAMDIDTFASPDLSENKKFFLQAATVRLLKHHKELSPIRLAQLVIELATKPGPICFQPTEAHLRAVIDQLSEKQYVEYDARKDLYIYVP
jgi:cullin 1